MATLKLRLNKLRKIPYTDDIFDEVGVCGAVQLASQGQSPGFCLLKNRQPTQTF
jgi:hypothetical protein